MKRKVSRGVFLAAKRGSRVLYYTGKKFSDRSKAKIFSSADRAMKTASALARRFPVLGDYILFPEIVRDHSTIAARRNPSGYQRAVDTYAGDLDRADDLLQSFAGRTARETLSVHESPIKAGLVVGKLEGVMYRANRDGEEANYFHRFKKNSRPLLIAAHDGSRIGIVGGRYRFTDRGIEDT